MVWQCVELDFGANWRRRDRVREDESKQNEEKKVFRSFALTFSVLRARLEIIALRYDSALLYCAVVYICRLQTSKTKHQQSSCVRTYTQIVHTYCMCMLDEKMSFWTKYLSMLWARGLTCNCSERVTESIQLHWTVNEKRWCDVLWTFYTQDGEREHIIK